MILWQKMSTQSGNEPFREFPKWSILSECQVLVVILVVSLLILLILLILPIFLLLILPLLVLLLLVILPIVIVLVIQILIVHPYRFLFRSIIGYFHNLSVHP